MEDGIGDGLKRRRYVPTATLAWFCIGAQRVSDEHQPCEASASTSASTRPVTATPLFLVLGSEFTHQKAPGTFFWLWPCLGAWVLGACRGGGRGLWDCGKWSVMGGWAGRSKGVQL